FIFVIFSQGVSILFHRLLHISHGGKNTAPSPDKRIKLLRFIARLNIGGPSIHVYLLTKGLNPRKFHSILVTGKISHQEGDMSYLFDSLREKPIAIDELQREIRPLMDIKAFFKIFSLLRNESPRIVDTHTAKAGTTARLAVILYNLFYGKNIRTVHTFHGHVFEGYFSKLKSSAFVWVERLLARGTDVIVAISESQKRDLSEKFKITAARRIKTIPLGFDLKPFLSSSKFRGQLRQVLGIDKSTVVIGIIGRLVPIKNHEMFFEAAKQLMEWNPERTVIFLVVGDGELRGKLEDYCRNAGIDSHVRFLGWMRNLPMVYADVDILALTSLNEGTPFSIIEAMASSVPVIATEVGGVPDLLGGPTEERSGDRFKVHERGILCEKGDAAGFAEGLRFLMEVNPDETSARIERARLFVEEQFSEARLLRDMETLYLQLVKSNE
ncbi:MAG: glycosyltransferase, partial [Gammaproteobacteria bacterium]